MVRFTRQGDVVAAQQRNGAMGHEETSIVRLNVMRLSSMGQKKAAVGLLLEYHV